MPVEKNLLRSIPKVDDVLAQPAVQAMEESVPHTLVLSAVRAALDGLRAEILAGKRSEAPTAAQAAALAEKELERAQRPSLRRVINATGVVLHTNLGRARMCRAAAQAAYNAACGYSTLEYNAEEGCRGSRYDHVEKLLCTLTGAESAIVVNNNAAAVMLVLNELVRGREAVVSRGELVEIGGSFRVPEIMEQSGGILREVGTTNKTHLRDYAAAIDPERTGALLKVHTSNYKIVGFTEDVPLEELVRLGAQHGVPVIYDLGSGAMIDFSQYGLPKEPTVPESVRAGADVVCFSGDKLLGGPQAGILAGKKEILDRVRKNPLTRALRVDKMTLAALEATLAVYRDEAAAVREIPTLSMLLLSREELCARAQTLCALLQKAVPQLSPQVVHETEPVGGGSMPAQLLEGYAVSLVPQDSAAALEARMRCACETPLVGRIAHDRVLLDVRTIDPGEWEQTAAILKQCV